MTTLLVLSLKLKIGSPVRVLSEDFVVPSSREDYYSESIVSHAVKKFSSLSEIWQVGGRMKSVEVGASEWFAYLRNIWTTLVRDFSFGRQLSALILL